MRVNRGSLSLLLSICLASGATVASWAAPAALKKLLPKAETKQQEPPQLRDKWALVIGCNRFADQSIPGLKYSSKNAADVARTLKDPQIGRFPADHVLLLNGPEATNENLTRNLDEWLYKKALPNDLVVIYISSRLSQSKDTHSPLLCLSDTKLAEAANNPDLYELLKTIHSRLRSEYIICLLDASPVGSVEITKDKTVDWLAKSGVTMLSASELFKPSYDNEQALRSRFANHFIEGMKAFAGNIPFFALAEGIYQNIKQEDDADPTDQTQTAKLALPSADSVAAGIPLGVLLKQNSNVSIGHPVDQIAMNRPDLVMPRNTTAIPPPKAGAPAKPVPKQVMADDDDDDVNPNVDFGPYMTKMKQDIQKKWQPPKGLESRKVGVVFSIARDGKILDPSITQSSGVETVDKSAMDALQAASPLDPLPKGAPRSIDIKYNFEWQSSVKR